MTATVQRNHPHPSGGTAMTITATRPTLRGADDDRYREGYELALHVRDPHDRAALARQLTDAAQLYAGILAGLRTVADVNGLELRPNVAANLNLAAAGLGDTAEACTAGVPDLLRARRPAPPTNPDGDLVDAAPVWIFTGPQIAKERLDAFRLGRAA